MSFSVQDDSRQGACVVDDDDDDDEDDDTLRVCPPPLQFKNGVFMRRQRIGFLESPH